MLEIVLSNPYYDKLHIPISITFSIQQRLYWPTGCLNYRSLTATILYQDTNRILLMHFTCFGKLQEERLYHGGPDAKEINGTHTQVYSAWKSCRGMYLIGIYYLSWQLMTIINTHPLGSIGRLSFSADGLLIFGL